jgi:hypothetical protein
LPLIKRSECLVFFFRDGKLHCKNYLTGVEVSTAPIIVSVLQVLGHWRASEEVERLLAGYSPASIRRTLASLRRHTFLLEKGSEQAKKEALLEVWKVWGEEARFFHFATKHAFSSGKVVDERKFARALLKKNPQPAQLKRYPRARQIPFYADELTGSLQPEAFRLSKFREFLISPGASRDISNGRDWEGFC